MVIILYFFLIYEYVIIPLDISIKSYVLIWNDINEWMLEGGDTFSNELLKSILGFEKLFMGNYVHRLQQTVSENGISITWKLLEPTITTCQGYIWDVCMQGMPHRTPRLFIISGRSPCRMPFFCCMNWITFNNSYRS